MRALSLLQPWASLLAWGEKKIETRSWGTVYRGTVAIHASKKFSRDDIEMCLDNGTYRRAIARHAGKLADLPTGAIVGIGSLYRVAPIAVSAAGTVYLRNSEVSVTGDELEFGHYEVGRWGWMLGNVFSLPEPIPMKGALGLWTVPVEIGVPLEKWWLEGGPFPCPSHAHGAGAAQEGAR